MLMTSAPSTISADEPIYLTNATLDAVGHVSLEDLHTLGLPTGANYPLTPRESNFVADDLLVITVNVEALMGYTVLWRGFKWFVPEIQVYFKCDSSPKFEMTEADAGELATHMAAALGARLAAYGVTVRLTLAPDNPEPDRHIIRPLFPASFVVSQFASYREWTRWLCAIYMGALTEKETGVPEILPGIPLSVPLSLSYPHARHRVSIAWETLADSPAEAVRGFLSEMRAPDASGHAFCVATSLDTVMVELSAHADGGWHCWTALDDERRANCICRAL